jgi:penicillin amidase
MLNGTAFWFADNVTTPDKKETIEDDVMTACKKACAQLAKIEKEGKLDWGVYKDTRVSHLLQIPALSRLHLPIGGGANMINATTDTHGPSWRMIVQLTDEIEAYCVYPGGQSGNPGSRYYDTFVDYWATGKYYRILFAKKAEAAKSNKMKWHIIFANS